VLSLHIEKRLKERGVVLDQQSENLNNKNLVAQLKYTLIKEEGRSSFRRRGYGVFFLEKQLCPQFL
jgi:hypothetical protein